jgi:hypothetical protein
MPLICYQSLNSSAAKDHGLKATTTQNFTSQTHNNIFSSSTFPSYLQYPKPEKMQIEPVEGPANLLAMAPLNSMSKGSHTGPEMLDLVTGKALQFSVMASRIPNIGGMANGARPDVMVFGEIDSSHPDWSSLNDFMGKRIDQNFLYGKTCQAFSVHSENSGTKVIGIGTGWIAVEVVSLVVVFVHVPNNIAKNGGETADFYKKIFNAIPNVDIILGDTNQPSTKNYTVDCVNKGRGLNIYNYISNGPVIYPSDSFNKGYLGTNSNSKEMYDVAVYNTARINHIKIEYVSQLMTDTNSFGGGQAVAISDHMGMIVYVE